MTPDLSPEEALARALWSTGDTLPNPVMMLEAEQTIAALRDLGYELRPIDDSRPVHPDEYDPRSVAIEQAAEAADREAAVEVWQREATGENPPERPHTNSEPFSPSAAVAPLDVDALAAALHEWGFIRSTEHIDLTPTAHMHAAKNLAAAYAEAVKGGGK